MAVIATTQKLVSRILVNNGTTQTGAIKTASVSMPAINATNYDADKVYAIAADVSQALTKTLYDIQTVRTESLSE